MWLQWRLTCGAGAALATTHDPFEEVTFWDRSDALPLSAQGLQQDAVILEAENWQTGYLQCIIQTAQPYRFAPALLHESSRR